MKKVVATSDCMLSSLYFTGSATQYANLLHQWAKASVLGDEQSISDNSISVIRAWVSTLMAK